MATTVYEWEMGFAACASVPIGGRSKANFFVLVLKHFDLISYHTSCAMSKVCIT